MNMGWETSKESVLTVLKMYETNGQMSNFVGNELLIVSMKLEGESHASTIDFMTMALKMTVTDWQPTIYIKVLNIDKKTHST